MSNDCDMLNDICGELIIERLYQLTKTINVPNPTSADIIKKDEKVIELLDCYLFKIKRKYCDNMFLKLLKISQNKNYKIVYGFLEGYFNKYRKIKC